MSVAILGLADEAGEGVVLAWTTASPTERTPPVLTLERDRGVSLPSPGDVVVLAVSASDGPMPRTMAAIQTARALGLPIVAIALMDADLVEDEEILELVELEVRELVSEFEYDGDEIPVVRVPSRRQPTRQEAALRRLQEAVARFDDQPRADGSSTEGYQPWPPDERDLSRIDPRVLWDGLGGRSLLRSDDLRTSPQVMIYTSGTRSDGIAIRDALLALLDQCGLELEVSGPEHEGSWWQRLRFRVKQGISSDQGQEAVQKAKLAIENQLLNKTQAEIGSLKAKAAADLIMACQSSPGAVVIVDQIVLVKYQDQLVVKSVDAVTASRLEASQILLSDPQAVIALLSQPVIGTQTSANGAAPSPQRLELGTEPPSPAG